MRPGNSNAAISGPVRKDQKYIRRDQMSCSIGRTCEGLHELSSCRRGTCILRETDVALMVADIVLMVSRMRRLVHNHHSLRVVRFL
jgi:hypothetical protein